MECNRAEVAAQEHAAPWREQQSRAGHLHTWLRGRVRVVIGLDNAQRRLAASMSGSGEVETCNRFRLHLATRRALCWSRVRYLL